MTSLRRSPLRIVAVVLGVILLTSLSLIFSFRRAVDRRWSAMESRVRELQAGLQSQGHPHAVLRGRPLSGDARADYEAAIGAMGDARTDDLELLQSHYEGSGKHDPRELDDAFVRFQGLLTALQRGARRESVTDLTFDDGIPSSLLAGRDMIDLATVATVRSHRLEELGRLRDAWELTLDAARMAADLNQMIALDVVNLELARILESSRLSPEESAEIAHALEILDRDFPVLAFSLNAGLLRLGATMIQSRGGETEPVLLSDSPELRPGWRKGFSRRLALVESFEQVDLVTAELLSWGALPWPEAKRRWLEYDTRRQATPAEDRNSLVYVALGERGDSDLPYRGTHAQIRILRVAAQFRATGEVLDLPDPFGDRLTTKRTGDRLVIISAGDVGPQDLRNVNFKFKGRTANVPTEIELVVSR